MTVSLHKKWAIYLIEMDDILRPKQAGAITESHTNIRIRTGFLAEPKKMGSQSRRVMMIAMSMIIMILIYPILLLNKKRDISKKKANECHFATTLLS